MIAKLIILAVVLVFFGLCFWLRRHNHREPYRYPGGESIDYDSDTGAVDSSDYDAGGFDDAGDDSGA